MRGRRIPQHDAIDLEPCSPNCPGCKAEQREVDIAMNRLARHHKRLALNLVRADTVIWGEPWTTNQS